MNPNYSLWLCLFLSFNQFLARYSKQSFTNMILILTFPGLSAFEDFPYFSFTLLIWPTLLVWNKTKDLPHFTSHTNHLSSNLYPFWAYTPQWYSVPKSPSAFKYQERGGLENIASSLLSPTHRVEPQALLSSSSPSLYYQEEVCCLGNLLLCLGPACSLSLISFYFPLCFLALVMLDFLVFLLSIKLSLLGSSVLIPALFHLANLYSSFMSQPRCHLLREVYLTQLPFQCTSIFVKFPTVSITK